MGPILSMIRGPESLKHLTDRQLKALAAEVREIIIETVASRGGYLSSNLAAVELTIALHAALDAPLDKLIWDGGHQTYTHQMLTGRLGRFAALGQDEDATSLSHEEESAYDVFQSGQASTSISAALGLVEARGLKGGDYEVVAVIGDGALQAGAAAEGLAQAGRLGKKMLVVLNDNTFAPASLPESLSALVSSLLSGRFYTTLREEALKLVRAVPGVGGRVAALAARLEEAARGLLSPAKRFRGLGLSYLGPVGGHRIRRLVRAVETAKKLERPVLLHVVTRKGKGYRPSEQNPGAYHMVGAFDPTTGRPKLKGVPPACADLLGEALMKLAEEDPSIVVVAAARPSRGGLRPFAKRLPERFYDVGRSSQHAVTFAAGLARQGLRPLVAIPSADLRRGFDQVLHDVCLQGLPVTFAVERAGAAGKDGPARHGDFGLSFLRLAPDLALMAPKDEGELGPMLKTALELGGPAALCYPLGAGVGLERDERLEALEVGKAELLRSGRHVAIWALGSSVWPAYEAAERLAEEGLEALVVNARFVKPLDSALLCEQARQVGFLVTVEENTLAGGFGSAVLEVLETARLVETKVHRIGLPDRFIEEGSPELLRRTYGLDAEGIAASVRQALESSSIRDARGSAG